MVTIMVTINEPLMVDGDRYGKMLLCLFRQGKRGTGWKNAGRFYPKEDFSKVGYYVKNPIISVQ